MTGTSGVIMPNDFNLKAGNSGNSAPAYTFRDDTNTGMFQDIDDALSFQLEGPQFYIWTVLMRIYLDI